MASKIREFDFITGVETSTPPTAGTPSGDEDVLTKGYADDHYVQGGEAIADVATLKAVADADRADGDVVLVKSLDTLFWFDSGSSATGDDDFVITPDAGTGRWLRVTQDMVTLTRAQALTNKDIDGGTASNTNRLTIPKDTKANLDGLTRKEGTVVYATDLSKFFIDDGTNLVEVSGSGGGGGINHIENPDAEVNTDGWATYADAAGSEPVDGTGGSATTTFTRTESSPLRDVASFLITKDAANRQGEGASYDFVIDDIDKNKMLRIAFDVDASDSSYVADDIGVYIYDKDNASLITPAFVGVKNAKYTFETTFASTDADDYRLIFHVASTNASAYTVKIDNVQVGPENVIQGVAKEDWTSFTPTWTNATSSSDEWQYARVGSDMLIRGQSTFSSVTNTLGFDIPESLTVDSSLITADDRSAVVGHGSANDNGSGSHGCSVVVNSTTRLRFIQTDGGNGIVGASGTAPFTWASGDKLGFFARVPIAEWANSAVFLGQADTEYAATNEADFDSSSTGNTIYGPGGRAIDKVLSAAREKTVVWRTPVQRTDKLEVELSKDQVNWFPAQGAAIGSGNDICSISHLASGAFSAGIGYRPGATEYETVVIIGEHVNTANDDSPSAEWPTSEAYWRIVKRPGKVQVAVPSSSPSGTIVYTDNDGRGGSSSGETQVVSFKTEEFSTGTGLNVVARTATTAAYIDVTQRGVYSFMILMRGAAGMDWGIAKNSKGSSDPNGTGSDLTSTSFDKLSSVVDPENVLLQVGESAANEGNPLTAIVKLNKGDRVRIHSSVDPSTGDNFFLRAEQLWVY